MREADNISSGEFDLTENERFHLFEGVFNFRDLGGYTTIDGRHVRSGTLFRSDNLAQLTHRDIQTLKELKVQTIVDLRTDQELERRGSYEMIDGAFGTYIHVALMDVSSDPEKARNDKNFLEQRYRQILKDAAPHIAFVVETVSDRKNLPLVFHCAVGKDRTGVVAMIILGALGVNKDTIVTDYALTALAVKRMLLWLDEISPDMAHYVRSLPRNLMSSEPQTMSNVIDWLLHTYGSFNSYLRFIGVKQESIDALKAALLE